MKAIHTLVLFFIFNSVFSQAYDDSSGWVEPWLNAHTGVIEGMNTNYLDVERTDIDTIFLAFEISYPNGQGVFIKLRNDSMLVQRVMMEINGYAIKEVN